MSTCPYTLPSFTFVGGSSKIISIELHNSGGAPFPVGSDVTVTFVLGSFLDDGPAVLTLSSGGVDPRITVTTGDSGVRNKLIIRLEPDDTFDLRGRYSYQIELTDAQLNSEIIGQGGITILRNMVSEGGGGVIPDEHIYPITIPEINSLFPEEA